MDRERSRQAGFTFGYKVVGPVLGVLMLGVVLSVVLGIAEAVW